MGKIFGSCIRDGFIHKITCFPSLFVNEMHIPSMHISFSSLKLLDENL